MPMGILALRKVETMRACCRLFVFLTILSTSSGKLRTKQLKNFRHWSDGLLISRGGTGQVVTNHIYFDLGKGGEPLGRIVFAVFGNASPKAALNFVTLSTDGSKRFVGMKLANVNYRLARSSVCDMQSIYGAVVDHVWDDHDPSPRFAPGHLLTCALNEQGPMTSNVAISLTYGNMPLGYTIGKMIQGWDLMERLFVQAEFRNEVIVVATGSLPLPNPYTITINVDPSTNEEY